MNKLAIFDLDGCLIDLRTLHFRALNDALIQHGDLPITHEDHLRRFDGLPTKKKLAILGYSLQDAEQIQKIKQKLTLTMLPEFVRPDPALAELLHKVYAAGYLLAVASNACKETVDACLKLLCIDCQISWAVSPLLVKYGLDTLQLRPKPSPDMYLWTMRAADACPATTIIFEDAPAGLKAAHASGATVVQVNGNLDHEAVLTAIAQERPAYRYQWPELNVLIPAAGEGQRFKDAGFIQSKPFIMVNGRPMVNGVIDNLGVDAQIYVGIRENEVPALVRFLDKYVVPIDIAPNDGTACTCLQMLETKDDAALEGPLLIANCDQILEWDHLSFYYFAQNTTLDAIIVTFDIKQHDPKYSYCLRSNDLVRSVIEKPIAAISETACTGVWFWKRGSDFVKYAEEMIAANDTKLREFYISIVLSRMIAAGLKVGTFAVERFHSLGTPEDLEIYLNRNKK